MKTRNYLLSVLVGLSMCACDSGYIVDQELKSDYNSSENTTAEILSFETKDDFTKST